MKRALKIILFLDFDGTLSPIAKDPKDAVLHPDIKLWLRKLSHEKNIKISIVTGRALLDIKKRVGLKNIIYAANHGAEIYYNGKYLLKKGNIYRKPIQLLAGELADAMSDIPGVFVEDKGLSVAIHFRKVSFRLRSSVKKIVKKVSKTHLKRHDLQLTTGKMILEIRPAKLWNKGKAVLWIWQKLAPKHMPIYIGDDVTDEDAFLALKKHGLGIRVGKKKRSHARYCIGSMRDLIGVLC